MSKPELIEAALGRTRDFDSFVRGLLADTLKWPIEQEVRKLDDIGFAWQPEELRAMELENNVLDGQVWQIQPLSYEKQAWGIFLIEFKNADVFTKGRGFTGLLRKVLRGLVPNRRKSASLPSWQSDNILFICTHNWEHYRFAHFRSSDGARIARMSTFGWGPESSNRTACEFNLPELVWPDDSSDKDDWVKKWTKAFDKEKLTIQFYKTFADIYEDITSEIAKTSKAHAQEHAQLLLDRMLFLSFLQKKRWLNNEPDYLYSRFLKQYEKDPNGTSYYGNVLFHLFQALSNRSDRPKFVGNVPFLNGGLFNLEHGDQVENLKQMRLGVKNSTFKRLFDDLLNKYNFTVMEDTPLNREVAVDPEMLGKVFETVVLVSDTGGDFQASDLRKATGSYYTPRIVVHFNCREVLLKYLSNRLKSDGWEARIKKLFEIDASDGLNKDELNHLREIMTPQEASDLRKAVERLKCCDPAVGSGAFAVGLLQELLNLTLLCEACEKGKDPRLEKGTNYQYDKKLQIIENSIYGVDIQPKAVDICKLRLWLSLVVDYELSVDPLECTPERFEEAINAIPPLPNLAYKIRQGDALLDQIHGVPFRLEKVPTSPEMMKIIQELKTEHQRFFKEENPVKKRHIRKNVLGLRLKLSRMQLEAESNTLVTVQEGLFGDTAREAEKRKWRDAEEGQINGALKEIDLLESKLAIFKSKSRLSQEDEEQLANLESGEGKFISFSWRLDFPEVFNRIEKAPYTFSGKLALNGGTGQQDLIENVIVDDGFDIMVGNPPFVTSRDKVKRELYRERWQPYCYRKYHLLVPFFPRSFGIMATDGQLGFIISNAFAKREFGKPLIELFFPTVELIKIVDCSGLMFPGHGTPTCIIFGRNRKPSISSPLRVVATLPGGGDLQTAPEDSPLWSAIEAHHDDPGYADTRVVVTDRSRDQMSRWPWNFDVGAEPTKDKIEINKPTLINYLLSEVGFDLITGSDEFFVHTVDVFRRLKISPNIIVPYVNGEDIRDYELNPASSTIFPYKDQNAVSLIGGFKKYAEHYMEHLKGRLYFGKIAEERGKKWWEFAVVMWSKREMPLRVGYCFIATHNHFVLPEQYFALKQGAPIIKLTKTLTQDKYLVLTALLNSSAALFWFKQVCFSKREAEESESGTYYEFAGGKVELLPLPVNIANYFDGNSDGIATRLQKTVARCLELGAILPTLSMVKIFEKVGDAYNNWNASLQGYRLPHSVISNCFDDSNSLRKLVFAVISAREELRSQMIALQEEMDWLVYESYGLIDEAAKCKLDSDKMPVPLSLGQRAFELCAAAGMNYENACELIPAEWESTQRDLWKRRLEAIRDNEHIRRIEQPVYKRRWYTPDTYEKQMRKAFEWWLLEKAEWWLENKKTGGPVTLDEWADALWIDTRVKAAVEVVEGKTLTLESFTKIFKAIINSETVPEGVSFAVPWEKIEAKGKMPAKVKNIRGKLNVPRERFRLRGKNEYVWAGLDWKKQE